MKKLFCPIILISLLLSVQDLAAQEAYNELQLTVTGHRMMAGTTIYDSWKPSPGIGFELSLPYYAGNLELGIRYLRFDEYEFENSGFHSHYVFAGWSYRYYTSEQVSVTPAIRLGNKFMLHDQDMIYGGEYRFSREESEISYEVQLRIQIDMSRHTAFYIGGAYNRTIFNIPFSAWYGSVGLSAKLQTPTWLRKFLK
jgi:hypothetical protein